MPHIAILTFVAYESDTLKRNSQNLLTGDEKHNNEQYRYSYLKQGKRPSINVQFVLQHGYKTS